MIKKLRMRFVLLAMSLIAMIMLVIFVAVYWMMQTSKISENEEILDLAESMVKVGGYFKNTDEKQPQPDKGDSVIKWDGAPEFIRNETQLWDDIRSAYRKYRQWMFERVITIVYSDNNIIRSVDVPMAQADMDHLIGENVEDVLDNAKDGTLTVDGLPYRYRTVELDDHGVLLLISFMGATRELDNLLSTLTTVGAIAFVIILIICIFASGRIIAPIASAFERQKTFIADASHELKTPLTVISANIDVIRSSPDETISSQEKWFGYIDAEISDMQKLINDMLSLARYDANEHSDKVVSRINLSDIATEVALVSESRIIETGPVSDIRIEEDVYINGDEREIKQVIMILFDNAIKNTTADGKIILSLTKIKNEAVIVCHNTGEGICEDELELIFGRFYRSDRSRARVSGGSGLGLAIARSITEAHGGRIYAESELHKWTKFTVRLPLAKKEKEEKE